MKTYIDKDALLHKMQERLEDLARNYCKYDNYTMGVGEQSKSLKKYLPQQMCMKTRKANGSV